MGVPSMQLLTAQTASATFDPTSISGCVGWWDAADSATITQSLGKVSQWDDKSASGLDVVQANGANQPTTGATTQNGRNVISFDSTDTLAVTPGTKICASAYTIFFVFRKTGTANSFEASPITLTAGSAARPIDAWDGNRFSPTLYSNTPYTNLKTSTSWAQITWTAATGSTFAERKDGAAVKNGVNTDTWSTVAQVLTIASRGDGVTKLTGDIAEIIVYDVALSTTNRDAVEDYLQAKWGTP